MKKILVVALAGLVVGLGGGTFASALRVKGEILEARAKAVADSVAAGLEHGEDDAHVEAPVEHSVDSVEASAPTDLASLMAQALPADADQPATAEQPAVGDTAAPPVDVAPVEAPARVEAPEPTRSEGTAEALSVDGARKLAKIFSAMKPADAAAVLSEMSDLEVRAVLMQLNDRQAGPILGSFPAERAATLSRVVLRDRGGA